MQVFYLSLPSAGILSVNLFFLLRYGLSLAWDFPNRIGQHTPGVHLPSNRIASMHQACPPPPLNNVWILRIELGFSNTLLTNHRYYNSAVIFRIPQGICPVGRSWHSLTPVSSDHLFLFGGFTTEKQPLSESFK